MKKKKKKKVKGKLKRKKKVTKKKVKSKVKKAKSGPIKRKKKKPAKPKKKSTFEKFIASGASLEEVGVVTHYFPRVEAAVVKLTKGSLQQGDMIIIKGHTTDFQEKVDSLQLDHVSVTSASIGQEIGLKVKSKVREHDAVYRVVG